MKNLRTAISNLKNEIKSIVSVRHSLRAKVALGVTLPLIVLLGGFTVAEYFRHRESNTHTLSIFATHIGRVIENDLRHQMIKSDLESLQDLIETIGALDEVEAVYLLASDGTVAYSSNISTIATQFDNHQPECLACHVLPVAERPSSIVVQVGVDRSVYRSVHIIKNAPECEKCHDQEQENLGLLITDISIKPFEAALNAEVLQNVLLWGSALVITLFIVRLVVSRFVLNRLENLSIAITSFGHDQSRLLLSDRQPDEIGGINRAFNTMTQLVESRSQEIQRLSERLQRQSAERGELLKRLITAQEDERKRVARDLHDELGQALGGLSLRVKVMERMLSGNQNVAVQQLGQIKVLINDTTDKMYDMIGDLRPSVLDDLGLVPAVRAHAEKVFDGKNISFSLKGEEMQERLPAEMETAIYRAIQEALNNILRHAKASQVEISLQQDNRLFIGEIRDNGHGFDLGKIDFSGENPQGLGILGMRERVSICGGDFEITTSPGKGTCIQIRINLEEAIGG